VPDQGHSAKEEFHPAGPAHRNPNPFTFHGLTPAAAALVRISASAPSLPPSSRSRDRPRRSAGVLAQAASPRGSALLLQVQAHPWRRLAQAMAETGTSRPPASGTDAGDFPELLGFCARAEALIAELLLLSDRAPPLFADRRFDPVLFDFR